MKMKIKGFSNVELASLDAIKKIVAKRQNKKLVWARELNSDNGFKEQYKNFEPILVDVSTANLILQGLDSIETEIGRNNVEKNIFTYRSKFIQICDIVWKNAHF